MRLILNYDSPVTGSVTKTMDILKSDCILMFSVESFGQMLQLLKNTIHSTVPMSTSDQLDKLAKRRYNRKLMQEIAYGDALRLITESNYGAMSTKFESGTWTFFKEGQYGPGRRVEIVIELGKTKDIKPITLY